MSYDRNVYVGRVATCTLKPSKFRLHWLLSETDEEEVRYLTGGRAAVETLKKFAGCHYVFPEFMPDSAKVAYIILPGYVRLDDVGRSDGQIAHVPSFNHGDELQEAVLIQLLKYVFDFEDVVVADGAVVEVV